MEIERYKTMLVDLKSKPPPFGQISKQVERVSFVEFQAQQADMRKKAYE